VGELRGRTERLYTFEDLEGVESTLNRLAEAGYVKRLPRQAGFKEARFTHLLAGDVEVVEEASAAPASERGPTERGPTDRDRIAALEAEVADLKRRFEDFKRTFE
jgi:uncharacterized protein YceH (UPF0502 family)